MTRLAVPPGVPLVSAQRRLRLPTYATNTALTDGVASATSVRARATATAPVATNTKVGAAWTQIIAATTSDAHYLWLGITNATLTAATDTSTLLDIGIGAGGSEVVIVPNLAVGYKSSSLLGPLYGMPVFIPGGSRVAIRCQSTVTAKTVPVQIILGTLPHTRLAPAAVDDIGTNLATSQGVTVTAPGSNNAKAAWTDIVTSTAKPYGAIAVGFQGGGDTTIQNADSLLDIGYSTDGGSSYSVLSGGGDLPIRCGSSESVDGEMSFLIPATIPAGSRLAARWATSVAGSSLDCILYGVPA